MCRLEICFSLWADSIIVPDTLSDMKGKRIKKNDTEIEDLNVFTEKVIKRKEVEISALKKVLDFLEQDNQQMKKKISRKQS